MNTIKHYENIGLSSTDIMKLAGGHANIVVYGDIHKYRTIDELINPYGCCFLLYESEPKWGHWCLVFMRDDGILEFFDPYGTIIDDQLDDIDKNFREKTNQNYPYLTKLLYECPYQIEYNDYQFQRRSRNIKTCGRWCICRWICKSLTLEEFKYYFLKKHGDELVTYLTMWVNIPENVEELPYQSQTQRNLRYQSIF